jgi:hypothetical protein
LIYPRTCNNKKDSPTTPEARLWDKP